MELAATLLRDLGFLLYAGPMVAFTALVLWAGRAHPRPWEVVRTYRSWGPGFGLAMGATVLGALSLHYLHHGAFRWSWDSTGAQVELAAWLCFGVLWASNIKLEIWTLEPLRKLDRDGVSDEAAYRTGTRGLGAHMAVQSLLVLATVVLVRVAGSF